jgi:hypothetical protein
MLPFCSEIVITTGELEPSPPESPELPHAETGPAARATAAITITDFRRIESPIIWV